MSFVSEVNKRKGEGHLMPHGQAMATRLCGTGLGRALLCRQHTLHGVSGRTPQTLALRGHHGPISTLPRERARQQVQKRPDKAYKVLIKD